MVRIMINHQNLGALWYHIFRHTHLVVEIPRILQVTLGATAQSKEFGLQLRGQPVNASLVHVGHPKVSRPSGVSGVCLGGP